MNSPENLETKEVPQSLELVRQLEQEEDLDVVRAKLGEMLESISADLGVEFISDVTALYADMQSENCLVRVDALSRVIETLELESPLVIDPTNEYHYANAVIPTPEGIKIALSEGQAPGSVRAVVGFGKTIVGFKTENITVDEVDFAPDDMRNAVERKFLCRHVSGELSKEDIRYLIIRIPSGLLEERYLTSTEKSIKAPFVFRGLKLGTHV